MKILQPVVALILVFVVVGCCERESDLDFSKLKMDAHGIQLSIFDDFETFLAVNNSGRESFGGSEKVIRIGNHNNFTLILDGKAVQQTVRGDQGLSYDGLTLSVVDMTSSELRNLYDTNDYRKIFRSGRAVSPSSSIEPPDKN